MATSGLCIFLFVVVCISTSSCIDIEEHKCTSRYDFEAKLLRDMIKLEFEMTQMKDQTTLALKEFDEKITSALSKLETVTMQLNDDQKTKLQEITVIGKDVEEKTMTFEETRDNLANDFAKLYTDFESKTDSKWTEIEAQVSKPPVSFLAHTVSDTSPGINTQLTFTQAVSNTGDAYDSSTGSFTAPVNGTYWFSVQMCPGRHHFLHVQIYAENTLIGSSVMYDDPGAYACSTVNAVAVLHAGDKVHVKSGGYTASSGDVIYQDAYRWAVFSGALVN